MTADTDAGARRWAAHWSQHWFRDANGDDRLRVAGGPSAGWATHVEAFFALLTVARAHLGVPEERPSLHRRLKAAGFDRMLRAWGMRALSARGASAPPSASDDDGRRERPVAVVVEIPTPSMMEPARLVAQELPAHRRVVVAADPRALRTLRRHGLRPDPLLLPLGEERAELRRGAHLVEALERVCNDTPPMPLAGVDLRGDALRALRRALRPSLPWLTVECAALRRVADRYGPGAWAIASDQHRIGRLVTEVAAGTSKVTVLQHGLPQSEIGYVPVVADRVATWSTESWAWFTARGTAPHRLAVTGNPRFDELAATDTPETGRPVSAGATVLLALSPSTVGGNARVVQTALDALRRLPDTVLVIKLHPGHREWSWVSERVKASGLVSRVRVRHHESLPALLSQADVTMVHRSTVAVESLVAGVPVVVIASDGPSVADIELASLSLASHTGGAALAETIRALREPGATSTWFLERRAAIDEVTGPADGNVASRVATLLTADADAINEGPGAAPS